MTFIPRHQEKHCFAACSEDKVNSGLCDCINRLRNENNMTTKTEFINKWKCWWMLQKQGAELTDAFEKELNAIIEQEIASKNLVKADIIGSSAVNKCNECSKELESGTVFCSVDCRQHYYH